MKAPNIYTLEHLRSEMISSNQAGINGKWVPARPIGYYSIKHRIQCAWMVFTGKGDVVVWPEGQ